MHKRKLKMSIQFKFFFYNIFIQKQHVSISTTQITFYGGLFDMIEHSMLHSKSHNDKNSSYTSEEIEIATLDSSEKPTIEDIINKLAPRVATLHIEEIEVKSLNKQNSFHYHLLLHKVDGKVKLKSTKNYVKAKIYNLRIYTPTYEVLYLKELSVDMRVSDDNIVKSSIFFNKINAVYNYEDIYGWYLKIFTAGMKSQRRELIIRAFEIGNQRIIDFYHSDFVRRIFNSIKINGFIELNNIVVSLELSDDQISSLNADKVIFQMNQYDEIRESALYDDYTMNLLFNNRHWSVEFINEGSLCFYMDAKYPNLNLNKRTAYLRGSAIFLGNTTARICSHRDVFKLNLHVNTFRTEYSNKFTKFTVQSLKCYKAFVNLFSQLEKKNSLPNHDENHPRVKGTINIEALLSKFIIDIKVFDISCYFINRHDVCTFINLEQLSTINNHNYHLDSVKVSTVDFTKYDCVCDLSEFSTTYISTSLLKIRLELMTEHQQQTQLCVDFAEKFNCSWNAHFLRHLLSLIRDFRKFRTNMEKALEIPKANKLLIPRSLPVGLDIKQLRNLRFKHADVNVDKLFLLINELSGENLFFYNYFH